MKALCKHNRPWFAECVGCLVDRYSSIADELVNLLDMLEDFNPEKTTMTTVVKMKKDSFKRMFED